MLSANCLIALLLFQSQCFYLTSTSSFSYLETIRHCSVEAVLCCLCVSAEKQATEGRRRAVAIQQMILDNNNKYIKLVRQIAGANAGASAEANLFPFGREAGGGGAEL